MNKAKCRGILCCLFLVLFTGMTAYGQADSLTIEDARNYGLSKREIKRIEKQKEKEAEKEYLKGRRMRISASFIYATLNSHMAVEDLSGKGGVAINLEGVLGFDKNKIIPKLDLQYSFNRRSSLYGEYYNITRKGMKDPRDLTDSLDLEIPEDAGIIHSFLNTQIWSLGYMYSFVNKPEVEVSFFANIFVLGLYTGIDIENTEIYHRYRLTAPLPSFGYRFSYEILPKVRFGAAHSFFFLKISDYGGNINNFKASLDYQIARWMRLGASYSYFKLKVESEARDFRGLVEYQYEGPGLYMQFTF